MDIINEIFRWLMQGINWIVDLIRTIWNWAVEQISAVPWNQLGSLEWWKIVILVLTAAGVGYFLYKAGKELLEPGQNTLNALATLLTAFVKTLLPVLAAGFIATAGAWIINNINF